MAGLKPVARHASRNSRVEVDGFMGILTRIFGFLGYALGLVLPVFAKIGAFRKSGRPFRWTVHIVVIVLILLGLGVLNYLLDLQTYLPGAPWLVKNTWLPLLFLLV